MPYLPQRRRWTPFRLKHRLLRAKVVRTLASEPTYAKAAKQLGMPTSRVKRYYQQAIEDRMSHYNDPPSRYPHVEPNDQAVPGLCLKLRLEAMPYHAIAARFNISPSTARSYVNTELGRIEADEFMDVDRARRIHVERIELLIHAIWDEAIKHKNLGAVNQINKLMDRQAKLLGLDAPAKVDISDRLRRMAMDQGLSETEAVTEVEAILKMTKLLGS